jgi:ketosteroid isomerase-like protein
VLARYCRAVDARDGAAVAALYTEDGREVLSYNRSGKPEFLASFDGAAAIEDAVSTVMAPHPPLGWGHHVTSDHIIDVDGDQSTLDAQFIVYAADGAAGTITATLSGYYRIQLRRDEYGWRMSKNEIIIDLPLVAPAVDVKLGELVNGNVEGDLTS